jgi:ferredoxin-NADP reductase
MLHSTTITGIKLVAKNTYELAVERPANYTFAPGQYTQVQLPILTHPDPKGSSRQFSIASAPDETATLRFVFRHTGSGFKETLIKTQPGDHITIENAAGSFLLPVESTQQHIFIAGGVGIAPFMSVLQQLVLDGRLGSGALMYGNQAPDQAAYISFLRTLKSINRHFTLEELYKKPTPELFAKRAERCVGAVWWVVGPPPMVATAVHGLQRTGVHPNQIRSESFTGY